MTPNYHEGTTKRKYCHEGATKQAQTTTKCHEQVPQFPPPKQMPRWGEARHLLKNLTLN